MIKKYVRATALFSAIACGAVLLTEVPQAFAQLDTTPTLICHRGQNVTVPAYTVPRRVARGDTVGPCSYSQ